MATLVLIRSFPAPNILFYTIVSFSLLLCASIWTHNNYIERQFQREFSRDIMDIENLQNQKKTFDNIVVSKHGS